MITKVALRSLALALGSLALALAFFAAPALAEPPPAEDFGRKGLWIGAQGTYGLENWSGRSYDGPVETIYQSRTDAYGFNFLLAIACPSGWGSRSTSGI